MITNEEKREVYALLKTRLKKAMSAEFWMEACMIEYNIIEDRTASILIHTGISKNASGKKLSNKLNSIEYQIGEKHPIISAKVSAETIRAIREWKEKRNTAVHKACITRYDEETMQSLAAEGKLLVDQITNESRRVKEAVEKASK